MPNASFDKGPPATTASLPERLERRYDIHNEAMFLRQQAADAKVALQQTLAAMQETAKTAADVRAWTHAYPWYAVGAAAVVGFITATAVVSPAPRESNGSRTESARRAPSAFSSSVRSLLFSIGRGMLMSAIAGATGAISANVQDAESEDSG